MKFTNKLFFIASLITSSTLATFPSLASTLSYTEGGFLIESDKSPLGSRTLADTITLVKSVGGLATANAKTLAASEKIPPSSVNRFASIAEGEGKRYFGLAQGNAKIDSYFLIGAGEELFLRFGGYLGIRASSEHPRELARSEATISLTLYEVIIDEDDFDEDDFEEIDEDDFEEIDYLQISARSSKPVDGYLFESKYSENIIFNSSKPSLVNSSKPSLLEKQPSSVIGIFFDGRYLHKGDFDSGTLIRALLLQEATSQVVTVPEPSNKLGFILILGSILVLPIKFKLRT